MYFFFLVHLLPKNNKNKHAASKINENNLQQLFYQLVYIILRFYFSSQTTHASRIISERRGKENADVFNCKYKFFTKLQISLAKTSSILY